MKFLSVFYDKIFFKFIIAGIINTLVGSAIMFGLYNLAGLSYWKSSALNYFFTSILSFFINKYFTFSVKQWSVKMIITFILTIAVSYIIAYSIAKPLVYKLLSGCSSKVQDNISMAVGMCLFTAINYAAQRFVVFRIGTKEKV